MRPPKARTALALAVVVAGCTTAQPPLPQFRGSLSSNEELAILQTRPQVTTRVLLTKPWTAPKGLFLHFPGGAGMLVNENGGIYGAFRRELAAAGHVVAVIDVPSDKSGGLGSAGDQVEWFRVAAEHTQDARAILNALHARWPVPVYVMGHSMGAISAAHLGASLNDERIVAVVLLGSATERGPRGTSVSVPHAATSRVKVPVLVVHHGDDGCAGSTFMGASRYPKLFSGSPRVGFIEVRGGLPPASPDPCFGDNYHSFFGIRRQVMDALVRWIGGEDVRRAGN